MIYKLQWFMSCESHMYIWFTKNGNIITVHRCITICRCTCYAAWTNSKGLAPVSEDQRFDLLSNGQLQNINSKGNPVILAAVDTNQPSIFPSKLLQPGMAHTHTHFLRNFFGSFSGWKRDANRIKSLRVEGSSNSFMELMFSACRLCFFRRED